MTYFFAICLLWNLNAKIEPPQETLNFTIIYKGDEVGELEAYKIKDGKKLTYTSTTKTTIKVGWEFLILFETSACMESGALHLAKSNISVNGKSHSKSRTEQIGRNYQFYKGEKAKNLIENQINYCSSMLLFVEPENVQTIYSEKEGDFHEMSLFRNQVYKKTDPKGRENFYYYKDGHLSKAEIDAGLINFTIVRKP